MNAPHPGTGPGPFTRSPGVSARPGQLSMARWSRTALPPAAGAWGLVVVAVLGISLAAPIAAATAAPALAVAFWRSAGGGLATVPLLALTVARRGPLAGGRPRGRWDGCAGCLAAGALLAVHFGLWLPSVRLTTVTASTALVATTPVWTVVFARWRGDPVPAAAWGGVGLALTGVVALTGIDAGHSVRHLAGDLLALGGGIAAAGYVQVGERVRRTTSTVVYTTVVYGVCALLLLPVCLVSGTPLAGWGPRTWIELGVLTFAAQLLGHSLFNAALPVVGATPLSLSVLLEVPGAALVAWLWLGTPPPWTIVPAAALILGGLVLAIRSIPRRDLLADPAAEIAG